MTSLPRVSELLFHSTTGARAEMAYQMLQKVGFKARYLIADAECKGSGCIFSE